MLSRGFHSLFGCNGGLSRLSVHLKTGSLVLKVMATYYITMGHTNLIENECMFSTPDKR